MFVLKPRYLFSCQGIIFDDYKYVAVVVAIADLHLCWSRNKLLLECVLCMGNVNKNRIYSSNCEGKHRANAAETLFIWCALVTLLI